MAEDTDWEQIARTHIGRDLEREGRELHGHIGKVSYGFRSDCVLTDEEITNFRAQLLVVRDIVEDDIVPYVDGVEQHGGPSLIPNIGAACNFLGITVDQLNEVDNGATVEITASEVRDVANGETVCYETSAGQTVRVRQTSAGEVNRGP